jgi:hypothetical protein
MQEPPARLFPEGNMGCEVPHSLATDKFSIFERTYKIYNLK